MPGFKNSLIFVPVLLLGLPFTSSCLNLGLNWQKTQTRLESEQSPCISWKKQRTKVHLILWSENKTQMFRFWSWSSAWPQWQRNSRCCRIQCLNFFCVEVDFERYFHLLRSAKPLQSVQPGGDPTNPLAWMRMTFFQDLPGSSHGTDWSHDLTTECITESVAKRVRGVNVLIVARFVFLWPCACILRLKLLKSQGTFPTDTKGWQSKQAQHKRHDHCHVWCFRQCNHLHRTRNHESDRQRNLFESNCAKTSKNVKTEALSHYSWWPSCIVTCLNDDWHAHAGRTIKVASALQSSSHQVRIRIVCSLQSKYFCQMFCIRRLIESS